jgi:hypothetical protein
MQIHAIPGSTVRRQAADAARPPGMAYAEFFCAFFEPNFADFGRFLTEFSYVSHFFFFFKYKID